MLRQIVCGFVCVSLLFIVGCRFTWPWKYTQVDPHTSAAEIKQYQQAITAYHKTEYLQAAESFEDLWMQTNDKRVARMALYGLACSKLMAANSPQTYNDALKLWQQWVENAPKTFDYENPALVDAFIKEKMLFSNLPLSKKPGSGNESEPMVSKWLLIETKLELDRMRDELKATQESLSKHQKMIKARESKIGKLKRQIKALEAIDQKIQKKKDSIPTEDTAIQR